MKTVISLCVLACVLCASADAGHRSRCRTSSKTSCKSTVDRCGTVTTVSKAEAKTVIKCDGNTCRKVEKSETKTVTPAVSVDQANAQQQAEIMAARQVLVHVRAAEPGSAVGIGRGSSADCVTCQFAGRVTGDASVQASSGSWFRVRIWRR